MRAPEYRPEIDGLRAVAVLAVMTFHLDRRWLPGGFFGVDIFFVISGYLITSVVLRECDAGKFSFARFYQRRIARLLPAFAAVAGATLIAAALIYSPQDLASAGATLSAAAASIANFKFLLQGSYFKLSPDAQPFLHCWSLSVEEQFYLFFPALLLLSRRVRVLAAVGALSLACYFALAWTRPDWAFYLLPARAWELLAGAVMAVNGGRFRRSWLGLLLIALSFALGRFPALPVLGTMWLLSDGAAGLSLRPMVAIGRMSYSLYLWHWPVFSLVDYRCYWRSAALRLALKVAITFAAAASCYRLIERPGRRVLNHPRRRRFAFAALACSMAALIPLGIAVRNANYVNAREATVRRGGLRFHSNGRHGSLMLMGDSNGSMYGLLAREIAGERDLRLAVISVEAGDPLPQPSGRDPQLWRDSLAAVQSERPDYLLLVCNWNKLADDRGRLAAAVRELRPYARSILLITQPPALPENATREAMRAGYRPPFRENPAERGARLERNDIVRAAAGAGVRLIDIEPIFTSASGEIRVAGAEHALLYQDRDHLSAAGAELVKPELLRAMSAFDLRLPPRPFIGLACCSARPPVGEPSH